MTGREDPPSIPRGMTVGYAIGIPIALVLLIFLPAGSISWTPGWIFLAVLVLAFGASAMVIARVNPIIFRARSRFQPGTKSWDLALVKVMLPTMVATIPIASLDAGRFHWSEVPDWLVWVGYTLTLLGIAGTAWAQAVNPFFEPGVRIQSDRQQHVVETGPYRFVRHPGYASALLLFAGMALALGSYWALIPAGIASALLVLRTSWEDRLLQAELSGYTGYARLVPWRLVPGLW